MNQKEGRRFSTQAKKCQCIDLPFLTPGRNLGPRWLAGGMLLEGISWRSFQNLHMFLSHAHLRIFFLHAQSGLSIQNVEKKWPGSYC
jgi:hypothetical protein